MKGEDIVVTLATICGCVETGQGGAGQALAGLGGAGQVRAGQVKLARPGKVKHECQHYVNAITVLSTLLLYEGYHHNWRCEDITFSYAPRPEGSLFVNKASAVLK